MHFGNLFNIFDVSSGGTGNTSFTSGRILFGNGFLPLGTDSSLFWNNTNKRLSVGAGTSPVGAIHINHAGSAANASLFERSNIASDGPYFTARYLATKNTDMGNGFGSGLALAIQDNAAVINDIAEIIGSRANNSDTTGNILFRPYSAGVATTRLSINYDGSSSFSMGSSAVVDILNSSGDAYIKIRPGQSNARSYLQLKFNYIGTEYEGFTWNSVYGSNSSFRSDGDLVLSHYKTSVPAWEQRLLFAYDRSMKLSTKTDTTGDFYFSSGSLGIGGVATPNAAVHVLGTGTAFRIERTAGGSDTTITPNVNGGFTAGSTGADSSAYFQYDKRLYLNKQSSVHYYISADVLNKTGNGTAYTIGTDSYLETLDQNGICSAGVATVQAAGRYVVMAAVLLKGMSAANLTCEIKIVATSKSWSRTYKSQGNASISLDNFVMDTFSSGDTISVQVIVTGEGADTVDIGGGAAPYVTYFSMYQCN